MSRYQETPVPEGAARMMTTKEILDSFAMMGPEQMREMLTRMQELNKNGLDDSVSVGDLKEALQDRLKDGK